MLKICYFKNGCSYGVHEGKKHQSIQTYTRIRHSVKKKGILFHCEKRFGSVESVALLSITTVLDPRFKKVYFQDPLARSKTLKYIADEIKQNQDFSDNSSDNDTTGIETLKIKCKKNCVICLYLFCFRT
jgi:hypothetical protein